ncbi:MAG: DUF2817 domain-containing protein, partial [Pseudomonadota bacterium]
MTVTKYFSANYSEARAKFLNACAERGIDVEHRQNPHVTGSADEDLFMDVACIGSKSASKVLFLMSGTHGVEGYCGSGAHVGLLSEGYFSNLPDDLSVVLVHAMNPYGFSHDRRVNEDNVDLNRNFLSFVAQDRPQSDYAKIHPHILPDDWGGPAQKAANKALGQFIEEHGMRVFQAAVSGGQYQHPDGVFYGGDQQTWSN